MVLRHEVSRPSPRGVLEEGYTIGHLRKEWRTVFAKHSTSLSWILTKMDQISARHRIYHGDITTTITTPTTKYRLANHGTTHAVCRPRAAAAASHNHGDAVPPSQCSKLIRALDGHSSL
ncbi:hypothetical protein J6590_032874 [Homalodisca vitripennis]|nr:hypothetical protein J6590_032874 [Homalodisca vitripennis]